MERLKVTSTNKITYNTYLKIKELTQLQNPLSTPPAHDEMLFIVIHQVYELWFKLVIYELNGVLTHLGKDEFLQVFHSLERVCEIFRVLIQQIDVLETMTPVEFNRFREKLNPASGFQSIQFRELELVSGANRSDYESLKVFEPEWIELLSSRPVTKTLRDVFFDVLVRKGKLKDRNSSTEVSGALKAVYSETPRSELQTLCEFLIRYDELLSLWRFRHVQMVERMIGMKRGTGGSLGVPYLERTMNKRFFPELWEVRTQMGTGY